MRLSLFHLVVTQNKCFNPRICKRCDFHKPILSFGLLCFNPRICKRCDSNLCPSALTIDCFNPRICKRCDKILYQANFIRQGFNPRICKRCDLHPGCRHYLQKSFNPRICKRCDTGLSKYISLIFVSIHASVKDATKLAFKRFSKSSVSIHASVKDATMIPFGCDPLQLCFNPRICKRCDSIWVILPEASLLCFNPRICKRCDAAINKAIENEGVSIHASVKDATGV